MFHVFSSSLTLGLLGSLSLLCCSSSALPSKVTKAFFNTQTSTAMELIARYDAGDLGLDAAVMEIITYNPANGYAYAVNGKTGELVILQIKGLASGQGVQDIPARTLKVKSLVSSRDSSFGYKDMTSVAVSPDGSRIAIALQAAGHTQSGRVALFDCAADGSLALRELFTVGAQPDMLCFADADTMLTANEGEPREGYGSDAVDPEGSVSVISIAQKSVTQVGFTAFDSPAARARLVASGVMLKKGALPSLDLEPEYIAVSGSRAYIALQEANAIAVLDIPTRRMLQVLPMGYSSYATTPVDLNSKDRVSVLRKHPGLYGARMPDAIATYQVGGSSYLVTANEGDGRGWGDYDNEIKISLKKGESSPAGSIRPEQFGSGKKGKVTLLDTSKIDGLDPKKDYVLGSRSFSIYQVSANGLRLVYDSGSDFERIVAQTLAASYSLSDDGLGLDDRAGKKGPEPECVTIGMIKGKPHAFIGLERAGGIMVYDISTPSRARFVNYLNTRDFSVLKTVTDGDGDPALITGGDISPEGLAFVPAAAGAAPLLLTANEVSGTVTAIKLGADGQ